MRSNIVMRRFILEQDQLCIPNITRLLHCAYGHLAEKGMRYLASHQSNETTLWRLKQGEGYLAFLSHELIGTVTLSKEQKESRGGWYSESGVASLGQFAVLPRYQGSGIGSYMMTFIEERAREKGTKELALDTSEHASDLIRFYEKRGYRFIEYIDWRPETNYRSVVLSKTL